MAKLLFNRSELDLVNIPSDRSFDFQYTYLNAKRFRAHRCDANERFADIGLACEFKTELLDLKNVPSDSWQTGDQPHRDPSLAIELDFEIDVRWI